MVVQPGRAKLEAGLTLPDQTVSILAPAPATPTLALRRARQLAKYGPDSVSGGRRQRDEQLLCPLLSAFGVVNGL